MRFGLAVLLFAAFAMAPHAETVQETVEPLPVDLVETENVRLLIIDALVVDAQDRTVPGLTVDDFDVVARGKAVRLDTLDVNCDVVLDDPGAVRHAKSREDLPTDIDGGKVVLALDYLHLGRQARAEVLDYAMELAEHGEAAGEEIMVAALNGGLRVEQTFTSDREQVHDTLNRMQHDITLWQPSFEHMNETSWVAGVTTLFDVLGTVPGPKKVVFFSAMGDVPLDLQFQEIAALAATSRCSVYPVDARGLTVAETTPQALRGGG